MTMISVKQAVLNAIEFLQDIQQESPPENVAIEEVELSDDGETWSITLGYDPPGASMDKIAGRQIKRVYKMFKIGADSGEIESMKIREP